MVITKSLTVLTLMWLLAVMPVLANDADPSVHLRGVVMPAKKVKLSFSQQGILRELASGGSLVKKGEVLGKLDDRKARAQLAQSKAEYRSAKSELASMEHNRDKSARLVAENILSDVALLEANFTVDVAREKVAVAKAKLGIAENTLEECTVLAPYDGAVVGTKASKGEWVKLGDAFMEYVNLSELTLSIDIPPAMSQGLSKGLTTNVLHDGAVVGEAQVKTIYPVIDPASGLRRIVWKIVPKPDILLSGQYVSLAYWGGVSSAQEQAAEGGQ